MKKMLKASKVVILAILALTVFFIIQLKNLRMENDIREYMPHESGSYQRLLETEDVFGSTVVTGISLETSDPTIFTADNIKKIDSITKRMENVENVSDVQSLTNIDYLKDDNGTLVAGPLLDEDFTGTDAEVENVRDKVADWSELYDRVIISDNDRSTQIQVTLKTGATKAEKRKMLKDLRAILNEETDGTHFEYRMYGDTIIDEQAEVMMIMDLKNLIPLVVLVVLLSLLFSFHTFDGTILPLLTVLMSTVWTVGIMAMLDMPFTIVSSIIPVALIAVGSAYGIHVLTHYYVALDDRDKSIPLTRDNYLDLIAGSLKEVMPAVMMAGVTTIAGFISMMTSPIEPLHSFALFTALGVAFALLLSITFIPCYLAVKPLSKVGDRSRIFNRLTKKLENKQVASGHKLNNGGFLYGQYQFFAGNSTRMTVFVGLMVIISVIGLKLLVVDTSFVNYFPAKGKVRQDIAFADDNFAGTNSVYLTVRAPEGQKAYNVDMLQPLDNMQTYLEGKYPQIGKTVSFSTFVKKMNQVMHAPVVNPVADESDDSAAYDDGGALPSFGDDSAVPSFGDDSSIPSFGDDASVPSFGDEGASASTEESAYVDPNIAYAKELGTTSTTEQMLDLLHEAYIKAGGRHATVEAMITELEKSVNYKGMSYYEVPNDMTKYPATTREDLSFVVAQYLTMIGSDLDQFINDPNEPTSTRMQIQLKTHSTTVTKAIIKDAEQFAKSHFPQGYTIDAEGPGEIESAMTDMVISSQVQSLIFSLVCVVVILTVAFKSLWAGLLGAVPLAFTILLNYMLMGFLGINLDLVTSIIASVAVGVGIDYTIHFMQTFKEESQYEEEKSHGEDVNYEVATRETFKKSGSGIVTNAMAVGLGFVVLCLSQFVVLQNIGILIAIVMFTSSFLAMTIIPGLLNAHHPKFITRMDKKKVSKKD
ncbi:RND family transporter [Treponema ruminis]|uniref:efflux RND transporter permease subunit n=1 Tax=Treponema ruminis TaxID=744515 RepID=UPI00197DFC87|nr:MMPL family transporter [Treponema ruminis]MCI6674553.1 MMPL family transporter [Spirochaetaceae bacterium]QSI03369.1 RND family transporter [Treponema ruminis]